MEEEAMKHLSESVLERDGKLIIEYKGARYELTRDEDGICGFVGPDEVVEHKLNLAYSRVEVDERIEAEKAMDYWCARPYAIGKKAAESLGAKIIEYEDEVYKTFYDDGTPIFY